MVAGGLFEFFSKPLNQTVFFRTLKLGALVAGTAAIIGYAGSFLHRQSGFKGKRPGFWPCGSALDDFPGRPHLCLDCNPWPNRHRQ